MSKEPRAHGAHELGGAQRSSEGEQWVMGISAGCSPSPALKAPEGAPPAAGAASVPRSSDAKGEGRAAGQVPLKAPEGAPPAAGAASVPRSSDAKGEGRAAGQVPLHPSGARTPGLVGGYLFIWV